jgi:hypothetical protein
MFRKANNQLTSKVRNVIIKMTYKPLKKSNMKTRTFFQLCFTLALCFFGSQSVFAQTPNTTAPATDSTKYLVVKNDGNEYVGLILSDDGREVLIQTSTLGKIYIPKSDIKSMRPLDLVDDVKKGEFNSAGVFTTRYQFTTNCFPIKKGENYAMVNLYGPEVHFAVHKDFSVGVMSTWIGSPLALALKYTRGTANPKINYGAGALIGTSGYLNSGRGFGGLYWGMITYGDRRTNVTLSVGYGHFNDGDNDFFPRTEYVPGTYTAANGLPPALPIQGFRQVSYGFKAEAPIIGLAGQTKVGKKASFIYDCMFIMGSTGNPGGFQDIDYQYDPTTWDLQQVVVGEWQSGLSNKQNLLILMPGMRFQRSDSKAFQISLAGVITQDISFPLPMASWFYKF